MLYVLIYGAEMSERELQMLCLEYRRERGFVMCAPSDVGLLDALRKRGGVAYVPLTMVSVPTTLRCSAYLGIYMVDDVNEATMATAMMAAVRRLERRGLDSRDALCVQIIAKEINAAFQDTAKVVRGLLLLEEERSSLTPTTALSLLALSLDESRVIDDVVDYVDELLIPVHQLDRGRNYGNKVVPLFTGMNLHRRGLYIHTRGDLDSALIQLAMLAEHPMSIVVASLEHPKHAALPMHSPRIVEVIDSVGRSMSIENLFSTISSSLW